MKKYIIFPVFVMLILFSACGQSQTNKTNNNSIPAGMNKFYSSPIGKAKEFPTYAHWLNTSRPYTMKDFKGKFVLLDFWTFCCINCMHVLPDLEKLEKEHPELVVVGVHSAKYTGEKDLQNIKAAILRYGIHHPVINDYRFDLWNAYGINAWPSFVLIDPNGRVVLTSSGEGVYKKLNPVISDLIKGFSAAGEVNHQRMSFYQETVHTPETILSFPGKLAIDTKGKRLFISDSDHNRIAITSPDGKIIEVIGSGKAGKQDGSFEDASFFRPQGMAYDAQDNVLYIADTDNHLIREANLNTKKVSTILGTGHQSTSFNDKANGTHDPINSPWDLALYNGKLVIAMAGSHQLWEMNLQNHLAQVLAGSGYENIVDGSALDAQLAQPSGLSVNGKTLYFADSETSSIRKLENDQVSTLIGKGLFEFGDIDGPEETARLQHPLGVLYHEGKIYIADTYNNKIKVLDPQTKIVKTFIGTGKRGMQDGPAATATLNEPNDIKFFEGKFYIADTNNGLIRIYDPASGKVSTLELSNLDMLNPKAYFTGKKTDLPAISIPPGKQYITLKIAIPDKYEVNEAAPLYFAALSQNKELISIHDKIKRNPNTLVLNIPAEAKHEGKTIISVEATIYYCNKGTQGQCFFKDLLFELPVNISKDAIEAQTITYSLHS